MIYLDGLDINFLPERERAIFIGRLFQNIYLGSYLSQTVRENLAIAILKEKRAGFKLGTKAFPNKIVKFLQTLNLKMENLLDIPHGRTIGRAKADHVAPQSS